MQQRGLEGGAEDEGEDEEEKVCDTMWCPFSAEDNLIILWLSGGRDDSEDPEAQKQAEEEEAERQAEIERQRRKELHEKMLAEAAAKREAQKKEGGGEGGAEGAATLGGGRNPSVNRTKSKRLSRAGSSSRRPSPLVPPLLFSLLSIADDECRCICVGMQIFR